LQPERNTHNGNAQQQTADDIFQKNNEAAKHNPDKVSDEVHKNRSL